MLLNSKSAVSSVDASRRGFLTGSSARKKVAHPWQRVSHISQLGDGVFWSILGDSADDFLVAGDDGVILHYQQGEWLQENSETKCHLLAMCNVTKNHVVAVGWFGVICERIDGQWHHVQGGYKATSFEDTTNQPLFDLTCDSQGTLWAVGDNGRICQKQLDGPWAEIASNCNTNFRSVLALNDGELVVGGNQGLILRRQGDKWLRQDIDSQCHIVDLCEVEQNNIIAIGSEYNMKAGGFVGRIFNYDGESWQELATDYTLPRLRKVKNSDSGLWLIGDGGKLFLLHEGKLSQFNSGVNFDLHDMLISPNQLPIFCGDGATVLLHRSEEDMAVDNEQPLAPEPQWQLAAKDVTHNILRAVWAYDDDNIFAVGEAGTILHYNGDNWQLMDCPYEIRLHDVWGSSAKNVFAVADSGIILHYDGKKWQIHHQLDTDTPLLAITGFGAHDVIVVGDEGRILRFDGVEWKRVDCGVNIELYSVWGLDSEHVLAAGGAGEIFRWNGDKWHNFNAGTDYSLYSVTGTGLNDIYFAGLSGTLIHFDGQSFQRHNLGLRCDLHAVYQVSKTQVLALGSLGTIMRLEGGIWHTEQHDFGTVGLKSLATTETKLVAVGEDGMVLMRDK